MTLVKNQNKHFALCTPPFAATFLRSQWLFCIAAAGWRRRPLCLLLVPSVQRVERDDYADKALWKASFLKVLAR